MAKKVKLRKGRIFGLIFIILLVLVYFYKADIMNYVDSVKTNLGNAVQKKESMAAQVNNEYITMQELDKKYSILPETYQSLITKDDLLDQMINEMLIMQQITDKTVDDKKVQDAVDKAIEDTSMTQEQLQESLKMQGLTYEELRNSYRKQIIINDFINETLFKEITISNEEIKEYYDNNIEQFLIQKGQVRARHILVETEEEAKVIKQELLSGKDFAELAKERSIGPSSTSGGNLGVVGKGMLVEEFENVLFTLDQGEISEPVQTQYGWHIIKRDNNEIKLPDVESQIRESLLGTKKQTGLETYIEQLKSKSTIKIYLGEKVVETVESEYTFNDCLKDNNAKLYIVKNNCKYCDEQIELLDNVDVELVYCDSTDCKEDVKGYPTWEINGEMYPGYKTVEELMELALC